MSCYPNPCRYPVFFSAFPLKFWKRVHEVAFNISHLPFFTSHIIFHCHLCLYFQQTNGKCLLFPFHLPSSSCKPSSPTSLNDQNDDTKKHNNQTCTHTKTEL